MRLSRWIGVSVFPAVVFAMAARSDRPSLDPAADHVRRHLDSVLVELRTDYVPTANDERQTRRARLVEELAAYRNRGEFPHNYDFPGQLVPYFRDRQTGTLCAVGDLLAFTGRSDIVDRVVHLDNNVRVASLAGDTAFRRWLDDNGLTLAEAARIQVAYGYSTSSAQLYGTVAVGLGASVGSATSFATGLANATTNRDGHSHVVTTLGFMSSAVSLGAGVALLHSPDLPRSLGAMSTSIGAAGIALSALSLHQRHLVVARDAERRAAVASVSLVPTFDVGAPNNRPRAGGALSIQF